MISDKILTELIKNNNLVSANELVSAKKVAEHLGCSLSDVLLGRALITDSDYGRLLSSYFGVPFIDLTNVDVDDKVLNIIPESLSAERNVVSFDKKNGDVYIAVEDPKDLDLIETVKKTIGTRKVEVYISTPTAIRNVIKAYKQLKERTEVKTIDNGKDESAVSLITRVLDRAIRQDASDVHIEALEDKLLIRLRVDGVLHDEGIYPKSLQTSVVARVKILSDLKIDETRLPQDGQFNYKTKSGEKVSLRVSTSPTVYGEKCVLRILKTTISHFNLEELGFLPEDLEMIEKAIQKTHGMFLVTGPTGSGKTTTLYTVLGLLNKPDVNIITIEDPVENRIHRVNQIQVNPSINLTFANGLRSILRQDPDIVMVGEIRDRETAVIAVNAAMTGHLVFSSVHANTAAGVVPRMIDLGSESFLLASTLNMVVAQRLVRVLCPKCKTQEKIDGIMKKKLKDLGKNVNPAIMKKLKLNYVSKGCSHCFNTGYKGRIGIFEILLITDDIREMIVDKASSQKIAAEVRKKGFKTMLEDGIIKVIKGDTSLEEVFRVISQ